MHSPTFQRHFNFSSISRWSYQSCNTIIICIDEVILFCYILIYMKQTKHKYYTKSSDPDDVYINKVNVLPCGWKYYIRSTEETFLEIQKHASNNVILLFMIILSLLHVLFVLMYCMYSCIVYSERLPWEYEHRQWRVLIESVLGSTD